MPKSTRNICLAVVFQTFSQLKKFWHWVCFNFCEKRARHAGESQLLQQEKTEVRAPNGEECKTCSSPGHWGCLFQVAECWRPHNEKRQGKCMRVHETNKIAEQFGFWVLNSVWETGSWELASKKGEQTCAFVNTLLTVLVFPEIIPCLWKRVPSSSAS